jgi:FkbM family methyltransferase
MVEPSRCCMPEPAKRPIDPDRLRFEHLQKLGLDLHHFFDVGASNGCWSGRISKSFPDATFDLFEPLVDHAPTYRKRMKRALARHPRFRLHKVALGAECKKTKLYITDNLFGSTALELGATAPVDWKWIEVDMLTIDYLVKEFQLPVPQVIKIDTQGCELSILQGAKEMLPQVNVLLLECWLIRAYGRSNPLLIEIADWLQSFGFHLWDVGGSWRDTDGTLGSLDCFFLNRRCRVSRLFEPPPPPPLPEPPKEQPLAKEPNGSLMERVRKLICRHT